METERSLLQAPSQLPASAKDCHTLDQWLDLVKGLTQRQVADVAGAKQSWISAIVRGHLPRKAKWPPLLKGFQLEGQEAEFYRMIMNAKRLRAEKSDLKKSVAETHPLLATAQNSIPAVVIPLSQTSAMEVRA